MSKAPATTIFELVTQLLEIAQEEGKSLDTPVVINIGFGRDILMGIDGYSYSKDQKYIEINTLSEPTV